MMSDRRYTGRARRRQRGRTDPFGLLVIAVMLAVSLTILVQAQASSSERSGVGMPSWFGSLAVRD